MRIRFDITLEDLIASEENRTAQSVYLQKRRNMLRRLVALYLFLAPPMLVAISSLKAFLLPTLLLSGTLAALFYRAYPGMLHKRHRRGMQMMQAEGELRFSLGEVEWEILETGLIMRIAGLETKMTWAAIERVETTSDYTYLHIESMQTCIFPHRRVLAGDLSAFLTELDRRFPYQSSLPASPVIPPPDLS